jgi:predicted ribosomally synthesized peptide with SipW-like signal peptide
MRRRVLILVAVGAVVAAVAGTATYAAFSSTTASSPDTFAAGTVYLTDNDSGTRMLSLTLANPGDTATSCIAVTYGGTLTSTVRLYGTVTGTIGPYVNLTVTRGSGAAGFGNCTGFTSVGTGDGVVYSGTLAAFPASYAAGTVIVDPQNWAPNDVHVYKFVATLAANNAAQGTSGAADFTWEARNT